MEGVRMEVIKSGLFKGAGIPGTSLDANQRKMLQDEVNEIHGEFKAAVKGVREFVDDSSMEGQTFSGKKAAEAGLVTGLVNGFDELMQSLDARVAEQMEADEENDERQEAVELVGGEEHEDEDEEDYGIARMASSRALGDIKADVLKAAAAKLPTKVKAGDESDDEQKDGVAPQPKSDEEEGEGEEGEIDAKDKAKDPTDPDDPDYDPDEDPELKAKTDEADEEADAAEKAIDTDSDTDDKSKHKRNKSRGVA